MKVEMKIIIKLSNDKTIEISEKDAKKLYYDLCNIFDQIPIPRQPIQPYISPKKYPIITCISSNES